MNSKHQDLGFSLAVIKSFIKDFLPLQKEAIKIGEPSMGTSLWKYKEKSKTIQTEMLTLVLEDNIDRALILPTLVGAAIDPRNVMELLTLLIETEELTNNLLEDVLNPVELYNRTDSLGHVKRFLELLNQEKEFE